MVLRYKVCVLTVCSVSALFIHHSPGSPAVDQTISVLSHPPWPSLYSHCKSGRMRKSDVWHDTQHQHKQQFLSTVLSSLLKGSGKRAQSFCRSAWVSSASGQMAVPPDGRVALPSRSSSALPPSPSQKGKNDVMLLLRTTAKRRRQGLRQHLLRTSCSDNNYLCSSSFLVLCWAVGMFTLFQYSVFDTNISVSSWFKSIPLKSGASCCDSRHVKVFAICSSSFYSALGITENMSWWISAMAANVGK